MEVLVTGAAGYIGSVVTEELIEQGYSVIALDNLKRGHRQAIAPEATFVQADLGNAREIEEVFQSFSINSVIHLAAESTIEYSMTDPGIYFHSNVVCGMNLLDIMREHGVRKFIFSSTAAVYGEPSILPIEESAATKPVNSYGESKLMFERILNWYEYAYGINYISLRYFNAAGASQRFGEDHDPETHLIPNVLKVASGRADHIPVFGTDYPTKDGSCIRDYVHVLDIAQAHLLSLEYLGKDGLNKIFNLGNGDGYSVFEVIEAAKMITRAEIPVAVHPRREGDPPILVANSSLAESEMGWCPRYSGIETIIESAWEWRRRYPDGYET